MNIFYLHPVAQIAATMHCDKHVGKMLIESCQLLATAHHHYGNGANVTYKPTHKNHPSAVWVRQSVLHYNYLVDLACGLGAEFYKRYGKRHKSHEVLVAELLLAPKDMHNIPYRWQTPPLAMPDAYKSDNALASYRRYYASKIATMPLVYYKGKAPRPYWLQELLWSQEFRSAA